MSKMQPLWCEQCVRGGRGDDSYLDRVAVDKVERRLFLSSVSNLIMVGNRNFLGGAVGED